MNYRVTIIDTQNEMEPLVRYHAERGSVSHHWLGGKDKDAPVIPMQLPFTLETNDGRDAQYKEYFTSEEKRYQVTKEYVDDNDEPTGEIVFRGFILPETYSEPYDDPLFYTQFEAVDGLGLLKGKTFSPDFYSEEKTLIEIISEALKMTQIDFDIYVAPAIFNKANKNWRDLYLNTANYFDANKQPAVYDILSDIIESSLCQLYQCQGKWFIEGINQRQMLKVKFYKYNIAGDFLGEIEISKNIKEVSSFVGATTVKMVPALGRLTVSQNASELQFPERLYQDSENEFITATGVDGSFLARDWDYTYEFRPNMADPDHFLELKHLNSDTFRPWMKISLRRKLYVLKNTKIRFNLKVQLIDKSNTSNLRWNEDFNFGRFVDLQVFKISLNDKQLYYNLNTTDFAPERLELDVQGKGECQIDFITQENGYLNIELFEPYKELYVNTFATYVQIQDLSIKNITQQDKKVLDVVINENSSIDKEIELAISDDITANSLCWQLETLNDLDFSDLLGGESFPIQYSFQLDGINYAAVSLKCAVLIEQFPGQVTYTYNNPVPDPIVHYNFNGGGEMVIETGGVAATGSFTIKRYGLHKPVTNRLDWIKWGDAVYGVEQLGYVEMVVQVYRRMFATPHFQVKGTVEMPLKWNDIIKFYYDGQSRFFAPSDLSCNDGESESSFIINECLYEGQGVGNVPPFVYAGPDINFDAPGVTSVQVTDAAVNDPDGEIVSLLWEQISGPSTATFSSSSTLLPAISNLVAGEYEFKFTAVDSAGASAFDTMKVYSVTDHLMRLDLASTNVIDASASLEESVFQLYADPEIPVNLPLLINFECFLDVDQKGQNNLFRMWVIVQKSNYEVFRMEFINDDIGVDETYNGSGSFNYLSGDDITVQIGMVFSKNSYKGTTIGNFKITSAEFLQQTTHVAIAGETCEKELTR